jgi:hypothetical protein
VASLVFEIPSGGLRAATGKLAKILLPQLRAGFPVEAPHDERRCAIGKKDDSAWGRVRLNNL